MRAILKTVAAVLLVVAALGVGQALLAGALSTAATDYRAGLAAEGTDHHSLQRYRDRSDPQSSDLDPAARDSARFRSDGGDSDD